MTDPIETIEATVEAAKDLSTEEVLVGKAQGKRTDL